ncbi:MAG TPA: CPBP family intramembrane glutamic endopeptidase [Thermoanaerobaculia bacterium]|nr:CPBP family intramembrane glutamic endopeptidase [Thermoanaerobaculia bacterium]
MDDEIPSPPRPEPAPPLRRWGLLATLGFSTLAVVVYTLVQNAALALSPTLAAPENYGLSITFPTLVSVPVGILLVLGLVRLRRGLPVRNYLGLSLPTLGQALGALAPLAAIQLVYDQLSQFLYRPLVPDFLLNAYRTAHGLPALYLAMVVAGPAFEELLFRGFLLPGLTPALGGTVATLLSALVFGLLHAQYDPLDMSFVFLLGLLLAGVRLKTGSTLLSFGLHALTNLIALAEAAWLISRTGG